MTNLPNILTSFRILLVPILVVVLLTKFEGKEFVGLGLFLLASLTDVIDGWVARRFHLVSKLGQLLDPAADKILVAAAYVSLVELDPAVTPSWMVVTILAREFAVGALRSFAASESIVIPAGWSGKLKTATQVISIALLIINNKLGEFSHLAPLSLWVALVVTIYSGIDYFVSHRKLLARAASGPAASA
jgi:CDP-diacylglycerol--glycerol-3-phosphate 3-phosphatidyltransferase